MTARRFRVLVTHNEIHPAGLQRLVEIGAQVDLMRGPISEDDLVRELQRAPTDAILMRGNPPLTAKVIETVSSLRVISKQGVGVDSLDLAAAAKRGVMVTTAGDANSAAVAELTMALLLALRREVVHLNERMQAGYWDRPTYQGQGLDGQTLGVIGLGRIGRRVADLARGFGMRVITVARPSVGAKFGVKAMSLRELLTEADVVSLHCPLTGDNRGFMNRDAFALMKPGSLLINTARGALINEADLGAALYEGRLGGAGLDVLSVEPPTADNPLFKAPNVIFTPHIGSETTASIERTAIRAAENIVAVLTGGVVDADCVVRSQELGARRACDTRSRPRRRPRQ
ncbi:MAG: hydroxyacid dehydrogenase [Verrucomicrobia bacterium]|nr:hydroxyacid dehydrogenase [Verrucomicrobiota bacterium]